MVYIVLYRMEGALLRMRREQSEQQSSHQRSRTTAGDSPDSPGSCPPLFVSQRVLQLQKQLCKKDTEHTERIVEMVI